MAFYLHSTDDGRVPAWEYLPCGAITPKAGLCLALNSTTGLLAVSQNPTHICMREEEKAVDSGTLIPVVKLQQDQVWEGTFDADTSYKAGEKCDIASNGLLLDADASTNDTFLLTDIDGAVARGRFVK